MEKTMTVPLDALSSEDQNIVSAAIGVVRAHKGKDEVKSRSTIWIHAFKTGLSFANFFMEG